MSMNGSYVIIMSIIIKSKSKCSYKYKYECNYRCNYKYNYRCKCRYKRDLYEGISKRV